MKFLTLLTAVILFTSCTKRVYFEAALPDGTRTLKKQMDGNKVVINLENMGSHYGGSIYVHYDFTFDTTLLLNIDESTVEYKNKRLWPRPRFFWYINQDTLRIDGDENIGLQFGLPPGIVSGDTLLLKLPHFITDASGKSFPLEPLPIIVTFISREEWKRKMNLRNR